MLRRKSVSMSVGVVGVCVALAGGVGSAVGAVPVELARTESPGWSKPEIEALTARLREAMELQRRPGSDRLLVGLRKLRDPALKPLFGQLAADENTVLRMHGILGLAELGREPEADLLLIRKIDNPVEQAIVLGEVIDAGLLTLEQLEDVARWPDLDEGLRVVILGRLARSGRGVDPSEFERYLESEDLSSAVFAALELLHMGRGGGEGGGAAERAIQRVLTIEQGARARAALVVLERIREERLTGAVGVVERLLEAHPENRLVRFHARWTMLACRPGDAGVVEAWNRRYLSGDFGERLRTGLAALEVVLNVDAQSRGGLSPVFAVMAEDDQELLAAMGRAGLAVAEGEGVAAAVAPLVRLGHGPSLRWVLQLAEGLGEEDARAVRVGVIESALEVGGEHRELYEAALRSAAALADTDVGALSGVLGRAVDSGDRVLTGAILGGVLRSSNGETVRLVEREEWPDVVTEALAELVRARHADPLGEERFDRLARIALVDPGVPDVFKVQAAWLALRSIGQERVALARALADRPG